MSYVQSTIERNIFRRKRSMLRGRSEAYYVALHNNGNGNDQCLKFLSEKRQITWPTVHIVQLHTDKDLS